MKSRAACVILVFIILLASFLRFYKLPDMTHFEFDQEYSANFAWNVLKVYPIQMIGQQLSVPGLFMGPWYFYFLVPFFALTSLNPIGGFIGSSILGLVNIFIYFWVGRKMFGEKIGLTLAFLRAVCFAFVLNDWSMAPALQADGIALLTWYFLYQFFQGQTKYILPIGFLFGLFTSFHPTLFPFYLVFIFLELIKRIIPTLKQLALALILFIIPISPLIRFEYYHQFWEIRQLLSFVKVGSSSQVPRDFVKFFDILRIQFETPFYFIFSTFQSKFILPFTLLFLAALVFFALRRTLFFKNSLHILMLLTLFFSFTLYFFFLPTHITEYYLLAPGTIFLLYFIALLSLIKPKFQKIILPLSLLVILAVNLSKFISSWADPSKFALAQKDAVVKQIIEKAPSNSYFFVSYIMAYKDISGYDYLFKLYGKVPGKDPKPPIYNIVYPTSSFIDTLDFSSGSIGLILPKK